MDYFSGNASTFLLTFMPIFGRQKGGKELTQSLIDAFQHLVDLKKSGKDKKKVIEEIARILQQLKELKEQLTEKSGEFYSSSGSATTIISAGQSAASGSVVAAPTNQTAASANNDVMSGAASALSSNVGGANSGGAAMATAGAHPNGGGGASSAASGGAASGGVAAAASSAAAAGGVAASGVASSAGAAGGGGGAMMPPTTVLAGGGSGAGISAEKKRWEDLMNEISNELITKPNFEMILENLDVIDFESSKYLVDLIGQLFRRNVGARNPAVDFMLANESCIFLLIKSYTRSEVAIHCGKILRDICRHEDVARRLLHSPHLYDFFTLVQENAFEISSDAFNSFKDLIMRHKKMFAQFLSAPQNYTTFFAHYTCMLTSEHYVARRQGMKLLGEVLLDRAFFEITNRYIADIENLKIVMNMLKSPEKQIGFETFHVFKVFVVNPNPNVHVHQILYQNKERLLQFFTHFQTERQDDTQFNEEKQYLIKKIGEMQPLTLPPTTPPPAAAGGGSEAPPPPANEQQAPPQLSSNPVAAPHHPNAAQ